MWEQLTLVSSSINIYGDNHCANEPLNSSSSSWPVAFVEGQCRTPTDTSEPQIEMELLKLAFNEIEKK